MDDRVDQRECLRRELDALKRDCAVEQFDVARLARELQRRIGGHPSLVSIPLDDVFIRPPTLTAAATQPDLWDQAVPPRTLVSAGPS